MGARKTLVSGEEEEEGARLGHAGLWLLCATGAKQKGQSMVTPPASAPWCKVPMRLSQLIIPTPMFLKLKNKLEIKY